MSRNTVFDRILAKELPAEIVFENDDILAFKDINPQAPIHIIIIPKKKVQSFAELTDRDLKDIGVFFQGIAIVAERLGLAEKGYRVVLNCGRHGQQTIDYIHAHLLGGRQMNWPPG